MKLPPGKVKLSDLNGGKDVRLIAILGDSYMSKDQLKEEIVDELPRDHIDIRPHGTTTSVGTESTSNKIVVSEGAFVVFYSKGCMTDEIPRDRRVLFKKKKKLNNELQKSIPTDKKKWIEKAIGEIDKKLLDSYEKENIVNEARAIENIKSNPKYFFTYARKKLKTRNKIGPFEMKGEKITSLLEICIKLVCLFEWVTQP